MTRIDEEKASQEFVNDLKGGKYQCDRSTNTEVPYQIEKEPRDSLAVKKFIQSNLFKAFIEL